MEKLVKNMDNSKENGSTAVQTQGLTLTWKNISVWASKKKNSSFWTQQYEHIKILNQVNGIVKSGSLMAIMGASGAGKTTLLATISQRIKHNETIGEILVNGRVVTKDLMCKVSGFVPQEELVTKALTVHEHMEFMARMKMDIRVNEASRTRRINSLLLELGLNKCADNPIYGISGGELKRLSLAVQLLTDPPLLFCDEPTTGLDSYNAGIVIEKLREFASRGKAVICTIHQPASGIFDLFHEVILLAGGRVAYHGSVENAAKYFDNIGLQCPVGYNQAEFYVSQLAVIDDKYEECSEKINNICDKFQTSKFGELLNKQIFDGAVDIMTEMTDESDINMMQMGDNEFRKYTNVKKVGFWTQLNWLLWRAYIDVKRNIRQELIRFALFIFIALLLATPYINIAVEIDQNDIQNMEGLMYLIITETVFTYAYCVFHTFPHEIPQLLREVGNDVYKPGPFYISKMLIFLPKTIIEPFVYVTIIFWIVGLNGGFAGFLLFSVPVIGSAITATAYGFFMSAAFESVGTASLVSVPIDLISLIYSGVFLNLANLPMHLNWIRYISIFYYGTECVSILQWSIIDNIACNYKSGFPCIPTGEEVLERYGFSPDDVGLDLFGLFCLYVFYHTIGYLSFYRRSKKQSVY